MRPPHLPLVFVLLITLGVGVLACGASSSVPETALPAQVVSSVETKPAVVTPVQHTVTPAAHRKPPAATSADHQASPLPIPTVTEYELSPIPTPTELPAPTVLAATSVEAIPTYTYRVVQTFPHDPAAYTQGLVFEDEVFYEGTGLRGQSTLRQVEPETGAILQLHALPPDLFGEGITLWKDRIIQLTWQEGIGLVYDRESFELLETFRYPIEGWGITHDGTRLIVSDGTATLHFWDPETFEEVGQVEVVGQAGPVTRLNELEYVEGLVYANVWQTDLIALIEPETGRVAGWLDLAGLLGTGVPSGSGNVLNGIAYSEQDRRLFVTGKRWPRLFEIELVPPANGG